MRLDFCALSSGSGGNCHYIGTKNIKLLIDAGLSGRKIENLLKTAGENMEDINGILITHEHNDHIRGAGILSRRYDIPIYANKATWDKMAYSLGNIKEENIKVFETEEDFQIKDLNIKPISVYHDAADPVGFIMKNERHKISIVTDTGTMDDRMIKEIQDSDLFLLESNHDIDMLNNGNYPYHLKERIRSNYGHMSNYHISILLEKFLKGRKEHLILGHISSENNTLEMAFSQSRDMIIDLGMTLDGDINLHLSQEEKSGEKIIIDRR